MRLGVEMWVGRVSATWTQNSSLNPLIRMWFYRFQIHRRRVLNSVTVTLTLHRTNITHHPPQLEDMLFKSIQPQLEQFLRVGGVPWPA